MVFKDLIYELEQTIVCYNPICLTYLNKGMSRAEFLKKTEHLNIYFPEEFIALYEWANGFDAKCPTNLKLLFYEHFPPIEALIEQFSYNEGYFKGFMEPSEYNNYFPIFATKYLGVNVQDKSNFNVVYYFNYDLEPVIAPCFDSIYTFFETGIACYKEKVFTFDTSGELNYEQINHKLYFEIGQKYNPNSLFWFE